MYDKFLDKKAKEIKGYEYLDEISFDTDTQPVETQFAPHLEKKELKNLRNSKFSLISILKHLDEIYHAFHPLVNPHIKSNMSKFNNGEDNSVEVAEFRKHHREK